MRQNQPRSLLVSGEPLVGKTSFLRLLAQKITSDGWTVFEARGADLQADQILSASSRAASARSSTKWRTRVG